MMNLKQKFQRIQSAIKAVKFTPVKTPAFFKHAFPKALWHMPKSEEALYLTFDDGPTPEITEWVLDTLNDYNAKATFFCIGKNVRKHPEIYQKIIEQGHAIGNHTEDHIKGWTNNTDAYLKSVEQASEVIESSLFRPPYGQISPKQLRALSNLGYKVVMWNVLSMDWDQSLSEETCLRNVMKYTKSGSIIVFHDSVKAKSNMTYCLPKVLDYYSKLGYKFKRIPELIQ